MYPCQLLDPLITKGTCFPDEERDRLNLRGLLPPRRLSLEVRVVLGFVRVRLWHRHACLCWLRRALQTQVAKNLVQIRAAEDPMQKFMMLSSLQDRNETIFFKLLIENIEELGACGMGLPCKWGRGNRD